MRVNREKTDSVFFYLFLFILWQLGSTLTVLFSVYKFPEQSFNFFVNSIIIAPLKEELIFRIMPLALGPLLLIVYQENLQNTLKNIIVTILYLISAIFIAYAISGIIVIGSILVLGTLAIILFILELVYGIFIIPRMHEKSYLFVIIVSAIVFGSGHLMYSIYYTIPIVIYGLLIGYYFYNRAHIYEWMDMSGKELTKNISLASLYVWFLHAFNNAFVQINLVADVKINNILQDIVLIVVFYIIIKLTVKQTSGVNESDKLNLVKENIA